MPLCLSICGPSLLISSDMLRPKYYTELGLSLPPSPRSPAAMSDGAYGPVYAKVAPRRPLQSGGAIYDNVVPIAARGAAAAGKTLQALKVTINGFNTLDHSL